MDGPDDLTTCPVCLGELQASGPCPECGWTDPDGLETARSSLKIVRGSGGESGVHSAAAPPVKVIRQLKLPTTDQLSLDEVSASRLNATLNQVAQAIEGEDFESADEQLDAALGAVIAGPGHQRRAAGRRWGLLFLILWSLVLLAVLVAVLWGGE